MQLLANHDNSSGHTEAGRRALHVICYLLSPFPLVSHERQSLNARNDANISDAGSNHSEAIHAYDDITDLA